MLTKHFYHPYYFYFKRKNASKTNNIDEFKFRIMQQDGEIATLKNQLSILKSNNEQKIEVERLSKEIGILEHEKASS
jgi:hypothetical protein